MRPRTLRARLLLSYVVVIMAALLLIAAALFGFASVSGARLLPVLERLSAISRTNQNELLQLWQMGADSAELQGLLYDTAEQTGVRILVVDTPDDAIIFDTATEDDWVGQQLADVERPGGLTLSNAGRGAIFGRLPHPDGTVWLVFAEPNRELGRGLIVYGVPEPTPRAFFAETFLQPLLLAGGLALLLSALLAVVISRSVAGPLQKMAAAAGEVAEGNYDQALPLEGPDEVRRVAGSFNTMTARVKDTQQAQRDFLANVSHDLKTPITVISGWSQAMLDGAAATPEEQQRAAETIYDEAGRMQRMVSDLLVLARLESGQLPLVVKPLDLAEVLADVRRGFSPQAQEKGVTLSLLDTTIPPVNGDRDRLLQVFGNLVDNALAFTPSGGLGEMAAMADGPWVVATVRDSGPGIPPDELPRIFERFYRVEKSRARTDGGRGAGLGLAIVRELVEAHGGTISVASPPGEGATFTVRLPAAAN